MKHWTIDDFETYLSDGKSSFDRDKLIHLQRCQRCKWLLNEQTSAHNSLKDIKPLSIDYDLFEKIKEKLNPLQINFFLDSLFVPSLILLFIVALFLFSQNTHKIYSQKIDKPKIISEKGVKNNISWENINYYLNMPLRNISYYSKKYNKELLIALFVVLIFFFYSTLDKYIKRRLF